MAILLVVLFHLGVDRFFLRFGTTYLGGGYVGVDVFYVISGYLITGGLVRELDERSTISLTAFYARRVRRLLPLGTLTILLTLVAGAILLPRLDWPNLALHSAAAAAFCANIVFGLQQRTYSAASSSESPFLHFWSLSIEEQFYLLLPGLLLLCGKVAKARRVPTRTAVERFLIAAVVVSFSISVVETRRGGPWAYYGLHSRMWELGVGGLLACWYPRLAQLGTSVARVLAWLGPLAIFAAFIFFDTTTPFPGLAALLPVLGTAAALAAGEAAPRVGASRWLSTRPFVFVGGVSYSWYLLHWPFIVLAGPATWALNRPSSGVLFASAGLSFLLAILAHWFIEQPTRRSSALLRSPKPVLLLFSALLTVAAAAGALAFASGGVHVETAQTPRGAKRDGPKIDPLCEHDFNGTETTPCSVGAATGATVTIIGDSHALQLLPALDLVLRKHGLHGDLYYKASCPPFDVTRFLKEYRREYRECSVWRDAVYSELARRTPRAIILARFGGYATSLTDGAMRVVPPGQAASLWEAGVRRTLARLKNVGAPVFILRDTPNPALDIPRCVDAKGSPACAFARNKAVHWDDVLFGPEAAVAATFNNVTFVDLSDAICPSDPCSVVDGDIIKYRDSNHLTATFALRLAPMLEQGLTTAL